MGTTVRPSLAHVDLIAAQPADLRVGKVACQHSEGLGVEGRIGVGKDQDVAAGLGHGLVQDTELPAARERQQADATGRVAGGDAVCRVGGSVGSDQDFECIGRIIQRQGVLQPAGDRARFIVGGNDEADPGRARTLAHATVPEQPDQDQHQAVSGVHVHERGQRQPEDEPYHAGSVSSPREP